MIDFACKEFDLRDIIKCSLALTKADFAVFDHLLAHPAKHRTEDIAKAVKVDLSTVQRAVKKLHDKGLVKRTQRNLEGGGYIFEYQLAEKAVVRKVIGDIVKTWTVRVEQELGRW